MMRGKRGKKKKGERFDAAGNPKEWVFEGQKGNLPNTMG